MISVSWPWAASCASESPRDSHPNTSASPGRTLQTAQGKGEFSIYAYPLVERRKSRKMESLGQLAGGVAHDFNNILQAIMGFSDMRAMEIPEEDARHEEAVEIRKMTDRAAAPTHQILAFSRKQVLAPADVDLNALVGNTEKRFEHGKNVV